jgi:hypothetical protein
VAARAAASAELGRARDGKAARQAGKVMQRVHLITEPPTDYLRFELAFYRGSVLAGEDIRILPGDLAVGLDLPGFDYGSSMTSVPPSCTTAIAGPGCIPRSSPNPAS